MLRLQREREKRGWNKSQLARRAKIALSDYSCIERQKMEPWEPQKDRLEDVLGVPAEELFEEVERSGHNGG